MEHIVILTSHKPLNYFFVRAIAKHIPISLVIYENQGFQKYLKLLSRRIKKLGLVKVFLQIIFVLTHRFLLLPLSQRKIGMLLHKESLQVPDIPFLEVDDINAPEVLKILSEQKPKAVVVAGTGILRKQLFNLPFPFINIHTGITPKYRGVFGGFWALYNRDFENIGVTVHLVDEGVDTGSILYQDKIVLDPQFDTFDTVAIKQYIRGAELMIQALQDVLFGSLKPFDKKDESIQWYHPTILEYFKAMRILQHEYRKK